MTDLPYTDEDLRAEAARQHAVLTDDPDFMGIGEQMDCTPIASTEDNRPPTTWDELSEDDFDTAQRAIDDLLGKAADVSDWAINLGAAGLEPGPSYAWKCLGDYEVAVHLATSPSLLDDARDELAAEIQKAVEATVYRVLGRRLT